MSLPGQPSKGAWLAMAFLAVRCAECRIFQVIQRRKDQRWVCRVCGAKQSLTSVLFQAAAAADVRTFVHHMSQRVGEAEAAAEEGATVEAPVRWAPPIRSKWDTYVASDERTLAAQGTDAEGEAAVAAEEDRPRDYRRRRRGEHHESGEAGVVDPPRLERGKAQLAGPQQPAPASQQRNGAPLRGPAVSRWAAFL